MSREPAPSLAAIPVNYQLGSCPSQCSQPLENFDLAKQGGEMGLSFAIRDGDYRPQLELLPRELALYSEELQDHSIGQVWLTGSHLHNIEPADLTWFCYQVGNYLRDKAESAVYGFEIDHDHISAEGLALLHGLHFRRLKIRFGHCQE
ncbi:MAG: hypothetical protein OIF34_09635, partial [Porticoccaceae bacterium]|nr:hypothetical protein [Porticoccaceae bacterium]